LYGLKKRASPVDWKIGRDDDPVVDDTPVDDGDTSGDT
jgi:hypothetical protein